MRKAYKILLLLLALPVLLLAIRFVFGGPEDTWICADGQWVRHGYPSAPQPETGCGPVAGD